MIKIRLRAGLALLALGAVCKCASAGVQVTMPCQKSLSDGHVLVANTHSLPVGSTYKVIGFQATQSANGWATGPCLLDVTVKAAR